MNDLSFLLDIIRDTIANPALSTLVTDQFGGMVLHIDGSRTNQLVIQVSNQTGDVIDIQQLSGAASSSNCNVKFTFPTNTFYFYTPPALDPSTQGSWQLATDSNEGWIGNIYLANTGACALQPKGQAGDTLQLIINYGGAVPDDSTLINVPAEVQYQNMQTASGVPIQGSTPTQTLTLMADEGQPLPLVGSFVGVATVLNDGTTQQNLTLRLVNTSEDPIEFIVPPIGSTQSYIEVALPVSDAAGDAVWALSGTAAWALINPSLAGCASKGWTVAASTATAGVFTLTPDFAVVQSIPSGGTIDLLLANVTSALEPGMVQVQVSLKRFAVYGTQSFGVALEKSPLVYKSGLGSGMTLSAGTLGASQALTVNGDSSSELIHLNQTGSGHALLVDGGDVTINHALNADSAAVSGTLSAATVNVAGNISATTVAVAGPISAQQQVVITGWDAVYTTNDTSGNQFDLIGTYQGWQPQTEDLNIYIAGYNKVNTVINPPDGYAGPKIYTRYIVFGSNAAYVDLVTGDITATGAFNGSGIMPIGSVIPFAGQAGNLPLGWLFCDGACVSRSTYAALFNVIGELYGPADGSTTFNIPDYRGVFLRGVDGSAGNDPDSSTRTPQMNGGNQGTATGNEVGTYQPDEFKSHNHSYNEFPNGDGDIASGNYWTVNGSTTGDTGGNETRPKNVYVNYLIRAL